MTATNYADAAVSPGGAYFYIVTATNSAGESANSVQASAVALPSGIPINLNFLVGGNLLQITWPPDHIGWWLEAQTNTLAASFGTNWMMVAGSDVTNRASFPLDAGNGGALFRLVYPRNARKYFK